VKVSDRGGACSGHGEIKNAYKTLMEKLN